MAKYPTTDVGRGRVVKVSIEYIDPMKGQVRYDYGTAMQDNRNRAKRWSATKLRGTRVTLIWRDLDTDLPIGHYTYLDGALIERAGELTPWGHAPNIIVE